MRQEHGPFAYLTDHLLLQTVSVLTPRRFNVTLCNPVPADCSLPQPGLARFSVADRIAAFLDGRTHGEDLLHELYDYILEEPIPQSMRELLK
jgi:hypothetical protein